MAVQEQTPLREYTANGVTTSFALGFDCEETNHLIVTIDDAEVLPTDWYLSGSNVIFWTAPGNGKLIKLQRNTPFNRLADYQSYNNSFRPPAINKEFDRIWWKLQELGVADWILHNRIDALKAYVDQQDSELQQNIDNLKIYVDDKDDELRAYLLAEIQKQGVALDQLDEYYNYLMQRLAQIAIDKGWEASFVVSAGGDNQQEINDRGGSYWREKPLGYDINSRVMLENGDIVKSTVANNTVNPNVDMTGWEFESTILKYNSITNSIQRQLKDVIYDLVLDVTWFGAKADHNFRTGVGTVNDTAFQNCINFIGSLGSIRDGGKVKISIPSGAYQLQHLDINTYAAMGFGLEFVGGGANSTILYFDESYTTKEAITCFMEGVVFRDIGLFGSLTSVNPVLGRTLGFVGKNPSGNADIDVTFDNCRYRAWDKFAEIHGRGFVATGGAIGGVNRFLTIVNGTYNDSTPDKPNNIMRHYRIQGVRFDSIGVLVKVEGTNPTQQINNIIINGDDIYTVTRLIEFDGFTVNGLNINGGNTMHSFATAMVRGTHLKNSVITGMNVSHLVDNASIPTADGQCIGKVVDLLGDSIGNIITGNTFKNLRENILHARGAAIGNIITGNTLPECWSWSNTSQDRLLVQFGTGVRKGNIITNNSPSSSAFTGTFKQTNLPVALLGDNIVKDNAAPWAWADAIRTASVNIYASGTDITSNISVDNRLCKFVFEGDYVVGTIHLLADTVNTGAISVGLPVQAVAEFPTVSTTFGGGGQILNATGFSVAGAVPAGVVINPAAQRLEFYKFKDMVRRSLNWDDGSGSRRIFATFRYRYK